MKYNNLLRMLAVSGLLLFSLGLENAFAQFSVGGGPGRYNSASTRDYNPFRFNFAQAWTMQLSDPVKLIEIAPVLNDQAINLLMMVDSTQRGDYRRQLLVTHWDGQRFITDTSINFFGTTLDTLLVGRFRVTPKPAAPVAPTPVVDKKAKKPQPPPSRQIATTEGIYSWTGGTMARLYSAPPNLRLGIALDGAAELMVINSGDNTKIFEAGDNGVQLSAFEETGTEEGFPHFGVGTQVYDGMVDLAPGIRYSQTYWSIRYRWQIGLVRGKSANLKDMPDATLGDRLVVYVPKVANKDRTFFQMVRMEQYEEAWRSPPLPGRVLDVRVGDPRREGKVGILVLTSENDDRDRHLYYFTPVEGVRRF
jgi:hypothetical protein